jgi:hypothetical protein
MYDTVPDATGDPHAIPTAKRPDSVCGGDVQVTTPDVTADAGTEFPAKMQCGVRPWAPPEKWTCTRVPPESGPRVGAQCRMVRSWKYWKGADERDLERREAASEAETLSVENAASSDEGSRQVILESEARVARTECAPKRHAGTARDAKPCPRTVMLVPPARGPMEGLTPDTESSATSKVSSLEKVDPSFDTLAEKFPPRAKAGARHATRDDVVNRSTAAVVFPNLQTRPLEDTKPRPVIKIRLPPRASLLDGVTSRREGGATTSKYRALPRDVCPSKLITSEADNSTVPAVIMGGVVHTMSVLETTDPARVCETPNLHPVAASTKPEPVTVTLDAIATPPVEGTTDASCKSPANRKLCALSSLARPEMLTENGIVTLSTDSTAGV